jgi:hypothetical protein
MWSNVTAYQRIRCCAGGAKFHRELARVRPDGVNRRRFNRARGVLSAIVRTYGIVRLRSTHSNAIPFDQPVVSAHVARCPAAGFCVREDQFPIIIQGPNGSRPRWLASASAPDLPVTDLVVGRVTRNEKAPVTWTVLELKSIPPSAFGEQGWWHARRRPPRCRSSLPRTWRHGVAGGLRLFLSGDRWMPTCQLSPGSDMPSHPLGSAMGQSAPPSFRSRHGRTCFDVLPLNKAQRD